MVKLDEQYNDKVKKDGIAMARKTRHVGSPLLSRPPAGAPGWAVDTNWKGKSVSCLFKFMSTDFLHYIQPLNT